MVFSYKNSAFNCNILFFYFVDSQYNTLLHSFVYALFLIWGAKYIDAKV